jgi:hypothetical protein
MYENGKIRHVETIPGIGEGGNKGEWYWIQLGYSVRTFVNFTVFPQYSNNIMIINKNSEKEIEREGKREWKIFPSPL